MKNMLLGAVALTALGVACTSASAAVVFSDNFNSYSADQLNWVPPAGSGWLTPSPGSVDIIGAGGSFDFYPGNGQYVDLAGSTGSPGTLSTSMIFAPGTYNLSFSLGGNARGDGDKTTNISLGSFLQPITLASDASLTTYSFTVHSTIAGRLSFGDLQNQGNGNIGNILDNVQVSGVPEPATWAMMLIGLVGVGFAGYLRSKSNASVAA